MSIEFGARLFITSTISQKTPLKSLLNIQSLGSYLMELELELFCQRPKKISYLIFKEISLIIFSLPVPTSLLLQILVFQEISRKTQGQASNSLEVKIKALIELENISLRLSQHTRKLETVSWAETIHLSCHPG
jgi:hypothetical protein